MDIRRIRADEGLQLRELRLRALADAPHAFAETLAAAQSLPEAHWQERAQKTAAGNEQATFIAAEDGRWLGMAAGFFRQESPALANLVAMWVDPSVRQRHIGQALVDAVVAWASAQGATAAQLWVTEINVAARALYERMQFVATGQTQPLPSNPALLELRMRRELWGRSGDEERGTRHAGAPTQAEQRSHGIAAAIGYTALDQSLGERPCSDACSA